MHCTVKLFLITGVVSDHKRSSWSYFVRTPQVIHAVRSRINQNPVQKNINKKIKAQKMNIASRTMSHIIKQDLGFGVFKQQTGQHLTIALNNEEEIKTPVLFVW